MIVNLKNNTAGTIFIALGGAPIEIKSGMAIRVDSETNRLQFHCYPNRYSTFKTPKFPGFIVLEHNFVLTAFYDILLKDEITELEFTEKQAKGDHAETYCFLAINPGRFEVKDRAFQVKDEKDARSQLLQYRQKDEKAAKRLKVLDILQTICYVGVPGCILFFGIWHFVDLLTALYITVPVAIVGVLAGLLIKKLLAKVNKKINKFTQDSNDLYVDTDSYFQKEYIFNVIKRSAESGALL